MSPSEPRAQIFNPQRRSARRLRAARRVARGKSSRKGEGKGEGFLLAYCARLAADRLLDISRQFEKAVIIGLPEFRAVFLAELPNERRPIKVIEFDDWPQSLPQNCDLVLSGLVLQSLDAVPQCMAQARRALRPDGLFLSAILGGESLLGLKRACFAVDQERFGGILPRVAPMIDLQQAAGLLGAGGLALPVVDRDVCTVNYKSFGTLIDDLRDIGETSHLAAMPKSFAGKGFAAELASHYPDMDAKGRFICPYEIIWMTGWAPHKSQQKPLKPGSAKMRLGDALKNLKS